MHKILSTLFFTCLVAIGLSAQVTVSGSVLIAQGDGFPVPDYPVILHIPTEFEEYTELTNTDENGEYTFIVENLAITEVTDWSVSTIDPCVNNDISVFFEVTPNQISYMADLNICSDTFPPPPTDTCVSYFEVEQIGPLTFHFETLVSAFLMVDSILWEFGDGATSDQLGADHTYADNGTYQVTLTVYTPTCAAVSSQLVFAFDGNNCNCFDVYDPVCVFGPNGQIITFSNECEAECSGYDFNQLFDCSNEECVCPTFVAPVCVIDSVSGDSLSFLNHCFAECEGYGPDQWFECTTIIDTTNCVCDTEYDPICVSINGQTVEFSNLCVAECAGALQFPIVDCDGGTNTCECDEYYDPVCVIDSFGVTLHFQNECFAACEGYTGPELFNCGPDTLDCNFFPFPVCVSDSIFPDSTLQFETLCAALDAGYALEELNDCGIDFGCEVDIFYSVVDSTSLTIAFEAFSGDNTVFETYFWDFGDGATSTEANPTHTYATDGNYIVNLTVNNSTCTRSVTTNVFVGNGGNTGNDCQAFFFFEQPDSSNLLTYQFINFSFPNGDLDTDTVTWDFGDGTTSNEANPIHTYSAAGSYTVTLTIDGGNECQSSIAIAINAGENIWYGDLDCRAWFLPIIVPDSNFVYFANWSSFDAVEFFWEFGDGTSSNDYEVAHQYADAGTYTVNLTITSESGCMNTYSVTIDIAGDNFTSNPSFSLLSSIDEAGNITQPVIEAFPNPTRDQVTVRWENGTSGRYDWTLVNIAGQRIQTGTGNGNGTTGQFELNLANEVPGIYLLQIRTPEGLQVVRLSKAN